MFIENKYAAFMLIYFFGFIIGCTYIKCQPNNKLSTIENNPSTNKMWPFKSFAYVKAYAYNLASVGTIYKRTGSNNMKLIYKNGQLNSEVAFSKTLNNKEIDDVRLQIEKIEGTRMYSKCFYPRHGIVFYDSDSQAIARIEVCYTCGDLLVIPDLDIPDEEKKSGHKKGSYEKHPRIKRAFRFFDRLFKSHKMPVFYSDRAVKDYEEKVLQKQKN